MISLPKKADKHTIILSDDLKESMKKVPLKERLRICLEMNDYYKWKDGKYSGSIDDHLNHIINIIKNWQKDDAKIE